MMRDVMLFEQLIVFHGMVLDRKHNENSWREALLRQFTMEYDVWEFIFI